MEAPKSKEVFKNRLTHEALRLGCTQDSPGKLFGVLGKKKKKKKLGSVACQWWRKKGESKQAASSSLHTVPLPRRGHPAQKPRGALTAPIRMLSPAGTAAQGHANPAQPGLTAVPRPPRGWGCQPQPLAACQPAGEGAGCPPSSIFSKVTSPPISGTFVFLRFLRAVMSHTDSLFLGAAARPHFPLPIPPTSVGGVTACRTHSLPPS